MSLNTQSEFSLLQHSLREKSTKIYSAVSSCICVYILSVWSDYFLLTQRPSDQPPSSNLTHTGCNSRAKSIVINTTVQNKTSFLCLYATATLLVIKTNT